MDESGPLRQISQEILLLALQNTRHRRNKTPIFLMISVSYACQTSSPPSSPTLGFFRPCSREPLPQAVPIRFFNMVYMTMPIKAIPIPSRRIMLASSLKNTMLVVRVTMTLKWPRTCRQAKEVNKTRLLVCASHRLDVFIPSYLLGKIWGWYDRSAGKWTG